MQPFTREDLQALLSEHQPPCVSLYVPDARAPRRVAPERARRSRTSLREAEKAAPAKKEWKQAGAGDPRRSSASLDDQEFWAKQRDTLAVFASPGLLPLVAVRRVDAARSRSSPTRSTRRGSSSGSRARSGTTSSRSRGRTSRCSKGNREKLDVVQRPRHAARDARPRDEDVRAVAVREDDGVRAGAGGGTVMYGSGRDSHTNEHEGGGEVALPDGRQGPVPDHARSARAADPRDVRPAPRHVPRGLEEPRAPRRADRRRSRTR